MFTYFDALEFLGKRERRKIKPGLERIEILLEKINNPHLNKKIIHIAGTKGKGSTSIFITNLLMYHGFKVGLYTSPHLQSFRERISINKKFIESKYFGEFVFKIKNIYEKDEKFSEIGEPTLFEILTALAFKYFNDSNVDFIVLETGLGGRFDATNIISNPIVTIITRIDYDHTNILGTTLKEIAFEKAGIIKKGKPLILSKQEDESLNVLLNRARELYSKVYLEGRDFETEIIKTDFNGTIFNYKSEKNFFNDLYIKLLGGYQVSNSSLALKCIEILEEFNYLKLNLNRIKDGLLNSFIAGRGEILKKNGKLFILDGAHNLISMSEVVKFINTYFNCGKIDLIFGVLNDKDIKGILNVIMPLVNKIIITKPEGAKERATEPNELFKIIKRDYPDKKVILTKNIKEAYINSFKYFNENYPVVVTGSFYVVGEFRNYLNIYYTY